MFSMLQIAMKFQNLQFLVDSIESYHTDVAKDKVNTPFILRRRELQLFWMLAEQIAAY